MLEEVPETAPEFVEEEPPPPPEAIPETKPTFSQEVPAPRPEITDAFTEKAPTPPPRLAPSVKIVAAAPMPTSAAEETFNPANIAFNTPKWMAYGETKGIHLVLDLTKSRAELEKMVEGDGPRESASIKTSHVVKANLTGGGFEITPISPDTQPVFGKEVTEWKWDIRAKGFRTQRLHLSLTALVKIDDIERTRGIRTFDRDIVVRIINVQSGVSAVQDNWPYVTGAGGAVLALIGWLARRVFSRRPATTTT